MNSRCLSEKPFVTGLICFIYIDKWLQSRKTVPLILQNHNIIPTQKFQVTSIKTRFVAILTVSGGSSLNPVLSNASLKVQNCQI